MEVQYAYTRDDWAAISMQQYKDWLYSRRPLSNVEYAICWFLLLVSLLGGVGCLGFLGWSIWFSQAWYFVVGSVVALVFLAGMFLEIANPRREAVRGLFIELIFRLNWEARLIEKVRTRRDQHYRRLEEKGQLHLGHQYRLCIDADGYTLTVDYPATAGPGSRQETRRAWHEVTSIFADERMVFLKIGDAGYDPVPRSAFADDVTCELFMKTAEAYRVEYARRRGDPWQSTDKFITAEARHGVVAY